MRTRTCQPLHFGASLSAMAIMLAFAQASPAQTTLYSGGEWDFENGFYGTPNVQLGECATLPAGSEPNCITDANRYVEYLGNGWSHWADFPPPDWTGPPLDWTTTHSYGIPEFNENQNMANVYRGVRSQEITSTCGNGVGMIYRQVTVPANHTIRFTAQTKFTQDEPAGPNVEPWMGLDPTGNTNPEALSVIWTIWDSRTALTWNYTQEDIVSTGTTITLFIMMVHREPSSCQGGTFMIDDVRVLDLGSVGPMLERSPASIATTASIGQNPPGGAFTVRNAGSGSMSYIITDDAAWLGVSPDSGSSTGEVDTITVNYDTESMALGDYSATITITAAGAAASPQTIPVSLSITHKPGDFDGDDDVDQEDFGVFQACLSGEGQAPTPECEAADFNGDNDVDQEDWAVFQLCISGANVPSDSSCAG